MRPKQRLWIVLILVLFLSASAREIAAASEAPKTADSPEISIPGNVGEAAKREAGKVKKEIEKKARSLFQRESLGWDVETAQRLFQKTIYLPLRAPEFTQQVLKESRVLGLIGSVLIFLFILVALYSLFGQAHVAGWAEKKAQPLVGRIPGDLYPYFLSLLKVAVSALIPLCLLGLFSLLNQMITYQAAWFSLTGSLLRLWATGAVILRLLKETLAGGLFASAARHGDRVYRYARFVLLYTLIGIAIFRTATALEISGDILQMLRFLVFVSAITILFLFLLKKNALMSLFPRFPYRGYRWVIGFLENHYYPLLILSFLAALLWCLGYRNLGRLVLTRLWLSIGALLAMMVVYYKTLEWLGNWALNLDPKDEAARLLIRSMKALLLYGAVICSTIIILNLLGVSDLLRRMMSFPIFELGGAGISVWIIVQAVLILLAFVFGSRLLQAYLDYKVYPAIGVDPGLGYALNTFFKYLFLAVGCLISLRLVGIDLRFLLVFAGAAGIGIGLGLQNMAANVISGFTIIFGGKIRKGDWIEAEGTLGTVTDIYLRATKVRTRDNIEYLIPNSELISKTIVNYSLSSPLIRIELPVGVSYDANPREVESILLEAARKEPLVSEVEEPTVRFVEYGDNSINFELLLWIDVRAVPRRKVRSALYFAIFEEFKTAGIEIPFPQRDLHIRNGNPA